MSAFSRRARSPSLSPRAARKLAGYTQSRESRVLVRLATQNVLVRADLLLRGNLPKSPAAGSARTVFQTALLITLFGATYGAAMGTFGGVYGQRIFQPVYSALKVPLLQAATFTICVPSFFVFNTLIGLRSDFLNVMSALVRTQAVFSIVLASLAPLAMVWYTADRTYEHAVLFNAVMFAIASFTAQRRLRHEYRDLVARDRRHRTMLWIWLILFAFVGIQMGWVLRPFIGDPEGPVHFFRETKWANAYVIVGKMIWRFICGQ